MTRRIPKTVVNISSNRSCASFSPQDDRHGSLNLDKQEARARRVLRLNNRYRYPRVCELKYLSHGVVACARQIKFKDGGLRFRRARCRIALIGIIEVSKIQSDGAVSPGLFGGKRGYRFCCRAGEFIDRGGGMISRRRAAFALGRRFSKTQGTVSNSESVFFSFFFGR